MKKTILIIITSIILLIVARVAYVRLSKTEIVDEPPIKSLVFDKHWITVNPLENTKLEDFVDTKFFYGFPSEINFEKSKLLYGEPNNISQREHNTYYEYSFDEARIEVGREEYSTGQDIAVSWALYSYPYNKSYTEVLSPEISKHIDPNKEKTTVLINNFKGDTQVLVNVVGNRVDYMILY